VEVGERQPQPPGGVIKKEERDVPGDELQRLVTLQRAAPSDPPPNPEARRFCHRSRGKENAVLESSRKSGACGVAIS